MSKEVLKLTIVGTSIIFALLSTTVTMTSVFDDGILSVLSPLPNVWALNVTGTPGPDTLTGTAESDNIRGHGGDDKYLVLRAMIELEVIEELILYMVTQAVTEFEVILETM
jgi:hypothetical protein